MPQPEPIDDTTISDDERLWHRVYPTQVFRDPTTGKCRPESGALIRRGEGECALSVNLGSLSTPGATLLPAPGMYLVEFLAKVAREQRCKIVRDPAPNNEAHALVFGDRPDGGLTKRQAKGIAERSKFIVPDLP